MRQSTRSFAEFYNAIYMAMLLICCLEKMHLSDRGNTRESRYATLSTTR